jgi:hypothetical protein
LESLPRVTFEIEYSGSGVAVIEADHGPAECEAILVAALVR